ncbi:hypothetical protein O7623_21585 [Solwaraspora sp. WMMD791]|uniref:FtsX-like permease family protein n=1 Tax=Solwaraspora sp. WMMD791 TaxID=3016086 RepID=UPI00249A58BC|nr:FtsX-like permease family protein [Solwaraspora sp. WMMD791]WFE25938.1 hypothetical protein O7623_21585 [Solwaraspora sp. WMMD791]
MTGPRDTGQYADRPRDDRQRDGGGGLGRLGHDLAFGARLAFSGGRDGWTRTIFTAVGVGIGVAMLLLAAAVPAALDAREQRGADRTWQQAPPTADDAGPSTDDSASTALADDTLLITHAYTTFQGRSIWGMAVRSGGQRAPLPPGVTRLPGPGEAVVSPALAELLASPDGALLAPRIGERIIGEIGPAGLTGPAELAFYRGVDTLDPVSHPRVASFGGGPPGEEFGPTLTLLLVVIFVVLLLPIVVFLGAAVRFGGASRDRRLAALRLVGADRRMIARIAAGEALTGAVLGLAVGALLFAVGRQIAPLLQVWNLSVFAADLRPPAVLVALVVVAAPLAAVAVGLIALRGVVVEPLGVVRRSTPRRRRAWWRLAVPLAGLALLYPLLRDGITTFDPAARYQVAAGAVLLLIGVVTLLPWLVETAVRRLRGGPVPWQLAIRRLQVDGGGNARLVSGVAVAVAGTIALQALFTGIDDDFVQDTGADPDRASHLAYLGEQDRSAGDALLARLDAVPGVTSTAGYRSVLVTGGPADAPSSAELVIADCAVLAELIALSDCADGTVFVVTPPEDQQDVAWVQAGDRVRVEPGGYEWTVPADARPAQQRDDPYGIARHGVFATPDTVDVDAAGPLPTMAYLMLDPGQPDAVEHVRNILAEVNPTDLLSTLSATTEVRRFGDIRRGLAIGIVVTLLLIGASMLVTTLEQLRERRRLLAMLDAFGTPRRALGWAVLWQHLVPVLLGLVLAVTAGVGLGAVLLGMVGRDLLISWWTVVGVSAAGVGATLLVAVAGLPALWRLMRADGLRTE